MSKVQMSCPRCRRPIVADVEQLFDLNVDPKAKERFLSGGVNVANCQSCGYQGPLATPVVYHDPEKELLLTFFPAELGLPVNEQEKIFGPIINQVVNKLPPEKRKAYLLRPQSMFTQQTMIETILQKDGIDPARLRRSQNQINLIQRLLQTTSADSRSEIVRQESELMDEEFFRIFNRLIEASMAGGDQNTARALATLQQEILPLTEAGRKVKAQSDQVQEAIRALQEAAKAGLTRETLLDLMVQYKDSDPGLAALVSMTRQGIDYEFLLALSRRIDQSNGEERAALVRLRDTIDTLTKEIDNRVKDQIKEARLMLEELLRAPDVEKAMAENLNVVDEVFVEVLQAAMQEAVTKNDGERASKLQKIVTVINQASTPPEFELIEQLVNTPDETDRSKLLQANKDKITPDFLSMIAGLIQQMESEGQTEMLDAIQSVYRSVLRFSMQQNLAS